MNKLLKVAVQEIKDLDVPYKFQVAIGFKKRDIESQLNTKLTDKQWQDICKIVTSKFDKKSSLNGTYQYVLGQVYQHYNGNEKLALVKSVQRVKNEWFCLCFFATKEN